MGGGLARDLYVCLCLYCVCVCLCVFGLTATVTENAGCAEAHAAFHEVSNRTKRPNLFSQLEEFANVHIRG